MIMFIIKFNKLLQKDNILKIKINFCFLTNKLLKVVTYNIVNNI